MSATVMKAAPSLRVKDEFHGSTAWRVLHRVLHQIDHSSSQSDLLAADGDGRQLLDADGDAGLLTESYAEIESLEQDRFEIDGSSRPLESGRGTREEQEILGQADQPMRLLEVRREHVTIGLRRALGAQGDLDAALEGGQRRPQLVGGVGREAAHLGEGGLQPGEHAVQGIGQTIQLITGPPSRYTLREVLCRDAPGGRRHGVHRPERGTGDGGPSHARPERRRLE